MENKNNALGQILEYIEYAKNKEINIRESSWFRDTGKKSEYNLYYGELHIITFYLAKGITRNETRFIEAELKKGRKTEKIPDFNKFLEVVKSEIIQAKEYYNKKQVV